MLTSVAVFIHDNVHLHAAARTQALLEHFNPPNNPDLALSDYHLFTYLKNYLGSQHFNNSEKLMEGVKTWLSSQAADFFDTGTQKLVPRYDKCHSSVGDFIEKQLKFSLFCNSSPEVIFRIALVLFRITFCFKNHWKCI
jgi:hypothetical protein